MNSEQEWLDGLRAGEKSAYEGFYRRHYRMVEQLVIRMGGDKEAAQDIFQEALFALIQSIRKPGFQLRGKVSTLLYAIARNLWLKKQAAENSREQAHAGFAHLPSEESSEEKEALFRLVAEGLDRLESDCRSVLRYAFYQHLPHTEIARLMGYSEAYVRVKKFRCLEYLRKIVQRGGGN